MENKTNIEKENIKSAGALVGIVLLALVAYLLFFYHNHDSHDHENENLAEEPAEGVELVETPLVNGKRQAPEGFPINIPLSNTNITESSTTTFGNQGAKQYMVTYMSPKTASQVYAELLAYVKSEDYEIKESIGSGVQTIFADKEGHTFSAAISTQGSETMVQISYLIYEHVHEEASVQ